MNRLSSLPWTILLRTMLTKVAESREQFADVVKDMLLDAGAEEQEGPHFSKWQHLPPLRSEELIHAMRDRVEQTLWQAAQIINAAPAGEVVAASEERVQQLFCDLCCEVLEAGLQMRVDAAEHGVTATPPVPGRWAEQFRRMLADEPVFPYPKDPVTGHRQGPWHVPFSAG